MITRPVKGIKLNDLAGFAKEAHVIKKTPVIVELQAFT